MKINYLKINLIALFAIMMFSCQKDNLTGEKRNSVPSKSSVNSEYSFVVYDNEELTKDIYTLVDADSMFWTWKSYTDGIFSYDFDCVWLTEGSERCSLSNDETNENMLLVFPDGMEAEIRDVVSSGNTTTMQVITGGFQRTFEVTVPSEINFMQSLVYYCQEPGSKESVTIGPIEFIRKLLKAIRRHGECKALVAEHAAECSRHNCRPVVSDYSVMCVRSLLSNSSCDCSQYNYSCNI